MQRVHRVASPLHPLHRCARCFCCIAVASVASARRCLLVASDRCNDAHFLCASNATLLDRRVEQIESARDEVCRRADADLVAARHADEVTLAAILRLGTWFDPKLTLVFADATDRVLGRAVHADPVTLFVLER